MIPTDYRTLSTLSLLELCIWREARGESFDGKRGVAWVIKNRSQLGHRFGGPTVAGVILAPWQFSSFNTSDPNASKWPQDTDMAFVECCEVAQKVLLDNDTDPTGGALFYFSPPLTAAPHAWGPVDVTWQIGNLTFCEPTPPPAELNLAE